MQSALQIIELKKLYFIKNPIRFCLLPYPGHPKGCPNVNKSPNCPPQVQRIENKYDLSKPCYFIVYPFNIAEQKAKMKKLRPDWSDKQCGCCLYWQNGIKRELKSACQEFICNQENFDFKNYYVYDLIPEAMGLNVFGTARKHGIPMVKNPQDILYKIAFVGVLL